MRPLTEAHDSSDAATDHSHDVTPSTASMMSASMLSAPTSERSPSAARQTPADAAIAAGIAQRTPDGSVVFTPPMLHPATVSRSADGSAAASAPSAPATSSPEPMTTGSATFGSEPAASAGTDLDALTDQLYERIEYRLRTDLLLERERLGCLPDL